MKIFKLFFITMGFTACFSYKPFIAVTPRTDIPSGVQEFKVSAPIEAVKDTLKANAIGYKSTETGLETEIIMIDEGTKAQYRIYAFEGMVKVQSYWGITEKVASQVRIWTGLDENTEEMTRVIYSKSAGRPKMVFDYGVQLIGKCGKVTYQ